MWCATGVNLSGGVTRDGGSIVGASVFYKDNGTDKNDSKDDDNEKLEITDESMEMKKLDDELMVKLKT